MEEFYETLNNYLSYRRCPKCNDLLWASYGDGHMWEVCPNCLSLPDGSLDTVSYVLKQPAPTGPIPARFEVVDKLVEYSWQESHETKHYRKKLIWKE